MGGYLETESSTWAQTDCHDPKENTGEAMGWTLRRGDEYVTQQQLQARHTRWICLPWAAITNANAFTHSINTRYRGDWRIRPLFLGTFKVPLRPNTLGIREDCFYYCLERSNVVVLFGTLKEQSFLLTEVSDCGLLIVVTSSTYMYVRMYMYITVLMGCLFIAMRHMPPM